MPRRPYDAAAALLAADVARRDPRVGPKLLHGGASARVRVEHAADNVAALAREQAQQAPGALDRRLLPGVVAVGHGARALDGATIELVVRGRSPGARRVAVRRRL